MQSARYERVTRYEDAECMTNRFQNIVTSVVEKIRVRQHLIDTLFSLIGINVFLAGLSFLTTMVIANILGKEQFGDFSYVVAVGGYCVTLAYCGLERTLVRDLGHFPKRFDELVSASLILRGSMFVLAFMAIFCVNSLVVEENRFGVVGFLIIFDGGIKSLYLGQVYDAWGDMKRNALYFLAERCLYFVCIWAVVVFSKDHFSIAIICGSMLMSTAMGLILQYRWALPRLNVQIDCEILTLSIGMLKENLWIWSAILATLSFGVLSKIVLKHISGSEELGSYAVAWQFVAAGSLLIAQVGRVGYPRMVKIVVSGVSPALRIRFLLKYMALSTFSAAIIGAPALLFPEIILRLFRPEYASASSSLRILGMYVIVVGVGQVATQYLVAVHKERVCSIVVILTGALSLLLYYLCIPRWSSAGAAFAVLFSHGAAIAIYVIAMAHHVLTANISDRDGRG